MQWTRCCFVGEVLEAKVNYENAERKLGYWSTAGKNSKTSSLVANL